MTRKFSFSDAFAAKTDALTAHIWKQVAASYHAPTFQLAGPHLRSYGNDMLQYAAALKYFLYLGLDGAYPLPDTDVEHDWDKGVLATLPELPIKAQPVFKLPPVPWREWDANGQDAQHPTRRLSQYREGNFVLGTVAFQDQWRQKRNLVAYWRNDAPPDGFHVGFCIDESGESVPGFAGEKLHFYSKQVKGAALVAMIAPTDVPGEGSSSLIFDGGAVVPDGKDAMPLQIQDGTMTVYLYPVSNGTPAFVNQPDVAHNVTRVTRSWGSADVVGGLHILSYLIVFRPTGQPAPAVSEIALKAEAGCVSASAKVDGVNLSVSFKN
jgi:hypothetical protein